MLHGWLIPVFSLCVLWRQRASLHASVKSYSVIGVLCMLISLPLLWLGYTHALLYLQQLSFISLLWSLVYALWGWNTARLIMFPILYLVFTISVPSVLETLILKLQDISTTVSLYLMCGFGFDVSQQGHALLSGIEGSEFQFEIAGACSGINSLLALTAFTALYAWYTQKTIIDKWLLFLCSGPIAIICNIIRVLSICLVAVIFGQEAAVGYYHDYSGYVIVLIAIVLIFKIGGVIGWLKSEYG
jgi:exosortase